MLSKGYDECWSVEGVRDAAEKGLAQSAQGVAKGAGEVGIAALPVLLHLVLSRGGGTSQLPGRVLSAMWNGICAEGGEKGVSGRGPQMAGAGKAYAESFLIGYKHLGDKDSEAQGQAVLTSLVAPMLQVVLEGKGGGPGGAFAKELMKLAGVIAGRAPVLSRTSTLNP